MFKELLIIESEDAFMKAMNYMVLCHSEYKAVAENIFDKFVNVHILYVKLSNHYFWIWTTNGLIQQLKPKEKCNEHLPS